MTARRSDRQGVFVTFVWFVDILLPLRGGESVRWICAKARVT
jgi:hypothetical protein